MAIGYRVVRTLWTRARNQCAFPSYPQTLTEDAVDATSGEVFVTVVGEQAHIRSSKPGGPRHDPSYPKGELDSCENLILLCPTHHKMIDDENGVGYSVEDLEKMRRDHERQQDRLEYIDKVVSAYVSERCEFDDKVLFEQVDLNGPSVDSMFVDVPFSCRARARLLSKDNYSGEALKLNKLTDVVRVPIRIDLRRYASWARNSASDNVSSSASNRDGDCLDGVLCNMR